MVFVVSNDDLSALRMVSVAQGQSTGLWLQGLGVRNPSLTPMFKTQDSRFFPTKSFFSLSVLKKHLIVFRMQENGFDAPQDAIGTNDPAGSIAGEQEYPSLKRTFNDVSTQSGREDGGRIPSENRNRIAANKKSPFGEYPKGRP